MMDRAKLIELIKWYKERAENTPMPGARAIYQATYDLLTQSPWISVKERLPEDGYERVLVRFKNANNIIGYPDMDTDRFFMGRWVRWGENVTHWMHLPEPPKGECV